MNANTSQNGSSQRPSTNQIASTTPATGNAAKFLSYLDKHKDQLAAALPKHLNADRMSRLALTCFSSSKQLQDCEPKSVFAAVVLASQMGLEIGVGGQGYIVPYKGKAQFIPGWMGIVDLVSRTGRATVWTGAVFEGDYFEYSLGDKPFLTHRPAGEDDPAKLLFVYAIGRVNKAEWPVIEVWSNARVRRHFTKYNKVGDRHYAHQNWEMYARKVPLLQVCKYMPKSVELTAALNAEFASEHGKGMVFDGEFSHIVDTGEDGDDQQAGAAKTAYPQDQFDQSLPKWKSLIEAGEKTAEAIIATLQSKATLSDAQKKQLTDVKAPESTAS